MMHSMIADLKQDNLKLKEELKTDIIVSSKQLADKIADTITRIDALETKFHQALHEQAVHGKQEQKTTCRVEERFERYL